MEREQYYQCISVLGKPNTVVTDLLLCYLSSNDMHDPNGYSRTCCLCLDMYSFMYTWHAFSNCWPVSLVIAQRSWFKPGLIHWILSSYNCGQIANVIYLGNKKTNKIQPRHNVMHQFSIEVTASSINMLQSILKQKTYQRELTFKFTKLANFQSYLMG